jgi:diguanylate cyclase (GGDEF)-like protein/PAS domain S-box-containing protein
MSEKLAHEIKILAVEDEPGDLALVKVYLRQAGYGLNAESDTLISAESLSEARHLGKQHVPDIILLDLNLPDSAGLQTVIEMHQALPGVPIIVLSGNSNTDVAIAALKEGAQDYLVKGNYEHNALGRAVRHALVRAKLETRLRLFEVALNSAANAIVITDVDAHIQWANPAFAQLTGYGLDETIGRKPSELVRSGKQDQPFYQGLWKTILSGSNWKGEVINLRKNGELYHEELSIAPVLDLQSHISNFVAIKQDISDRKNAQEKLLRNEKKLSSILESADDAIFITDQQGHYQYVNQQATQLLGYSREQLLKMNIRDVTPVEELPVVLPLFEKFLASGSMRTELRLKCKNGTTVAVDFNGTMLPDGSLFGSCRDITEHKLSQKKLLQSEARLRAILDNSPYLIWLKDLDGRFISVNRAFFQTTGLASIDEVLGKTDFEIWPEDLAKKYRADDAKVISTRSQLITEEILMDNGVKHWVETIKTPIQDINGHLLGTTGFAQNITERKNAEVQIRHLAHYDPLTDLPNRTLFSDRLQQALSIAKRDKERIALIFIDLDKFKPINDALGHYVGDLLLMEVARRMQDCVRESDTVARLGGDEFVVLLPVIEAPEDAVLVAEKIRLALNQPFELVGQSLSISSSTGIAIYPEHGTEETQLVKNADIAMYHAKEAGRNNVKVFQPEMNYGKQ